MDVLSAKLAYDALKSAKDLIGGAFEARVDAEARPKVQAALGQLNDAMSAIFEMREELFRLQSENQRLSSELDSANQWTLRGAKYTLSHTRGGAVVYAYAETPSHYACPSCFEKRSLQILQTTRGFGYFVCPGCKTEYPVEPIAPMDPMRVSR
jgi:hypothetical protein